MHIGATQFLGGDNLSSRGAHQGRAAQKDRALLAYDDAFIRHGGHIGAAGRAAAHHHGDLRYAFRRHIRLIEEDTAEMIPVRENLILLRQKGAAGIHQINTRQAIGAGDFLCTQMLLHGQWKIGAALHCGIIGDDHAFAPRYAPNARDNPRTRNLPTIQTMGRELGKLQEGRTRINQGVHAFARQQLIAR